MIAVATCILSEPRSAFVSSEVNPDRLRPLRKPPGHVWRRGFDWTFGEGAKTSPARRAAHADLLTASACKTRRGAASPTGLIPPRHVPDYVIKTSEPSMARVRYDCEFRSRLTVMAKQISVNREREVTVYAYVRRV